jgi:hypothetical protein
LHKTSRSTFLAQVQRRLHRFRVETTNQHRIRQKSAEVARNAHTRDDVHPVVFFNASTRLNGLSLNAGFSLVTSWALQLEGVPVVHFVCECGMSRCVLGTQRDRIQVDPPCSECTAFSSMLYNGARVYPFNFQTNIDLENRLSSLDLSALMRFESDGLPLGELILPSLRWILRRHHIFDDKPTRYLFRQYILSAHVVASEFKKLLVDVDPSAVVIFNGMFFPEAIVKTLARRCGLPVFSHEVALRPFTAFFTAGEATAYPIDIPPDFELSPDQEARLDGYLVQRFQGNFSMAGIQFWPEIKGLSAEFWQRAAQFRQIVPVFTNVIFDTSQGHANVVYPHMFSWLDQVLELMRTHPDTLFVLRAHPDESRPGKESRESVAEWVKQNQVQDLPNVIFVGADEYLSSYELIHHSKFVMVYNSTIGLEASLLGAAVLCAGRARYTQLFTVFLPSTPEDHRRKAEDFLAADKVKVPEEYRRNARRFLYFQLYRTALPFGDYLEDSGVWQGYVTLKDFQLQNLLTKNSPTLKIVVDGILNNKPFLLDK